MKVTYAPDYQQELSVEFLQHLCKGVMHIKDMNERKSALCWVGVKTAAMAVGISAKGMSFKEKESLKQSAIESFEKTFEEITAEGRS